RSVSAFLLNRSSDLIMSNIQTEAKMGKVMRHTLGASLNIRHNLSSSKGPKPLQLKLLTTYIPKTSAFTLAFSTSQRLRTTRASRSEERRVGKEMGWRWWAKESKKKEMKNREDVRKA